MDDFDFQVSKGCNKMCHELSFSDMPLKKFDFENIVYYIQIYFYMKYLKAQESILEIDLD